jgi:hypothetical protein
VPAVLLFSLLSLRERRAGEVRAGGEARSVSEKTLESGKA